jgi:hypothetical protein
MHPTGGSDETQAAKELSVEYDSIDLGAIYRYSNATRFGIMLKNMIGFSFKKKYDRFALPHYTTLSISHGIGSTTFSLDSEYIFGEFGGYQKQSANIWFLRGGLENRLTPYLHLRAGLIYPLMARSSALGDLKAGIPWPKIGPCLGLGLILNRFNLDLALYGDPAKSYIEQTPTLGATSTLTFKF